MLSPFNLAEPLEEILLREKEVFFQKTWDSRGPFAGAGHDRIYKWEGVYWVWEYLGVYQPWDGKCGIIGPYETYKDALRSSEAVCAITEATTELRSELSRREVRRFLGIYLEEPVVQFEWNGERVRAHRSGRITFVRKNFISSQRSVEIKFECGQGL